MPRRRRGWLKQNYFRKCIFSISSLFIIFYIYFSIFKVGGWKVGRKEKEKNKRNNYLPTDIRSIYNVFQGGHTATQNRTRKNTRRSHTLQVRITREFGTRRFGM